MRQIIIYSIILLIFTGGCGKNDKPPTTQKISVEADSVTVELIASDSTTAFELLQANKEINYRGTVSGKFVIAIDSVESSDGYFWLYSVNSENPKVASDRFAVAPGDTVRWHFRSSQ